MKPRLEDIAWCEVHNVLVHPNPRGDFGTTRRMEGLRPKSRNTQVSAFRCPAREKEKDAKSLMLNVFHRKTPSIGELRNSCHTLTK